MEGEAVGTGIAAHVLGEERMINREVEKMWAHCECRPKKLRHRDLAA